MIRFSIRLLSTLSFPKCSSAFRISHQNIFCIPSIHDTHSGCFVLPKLIFMWKAKIISLCNIWNLFCRMKDSCFLGHHPGVYAPSYSICAEITTKFGNRHPHMQSKNATCHVIRHIFTYSFRNCNITITETRGFGNANA